MEMTDKASWKYKENCVVTNHKKTKYEEDKDGSALQLPNEKVGCISLKPQLDPEEIDEHLPIKRKKVETSIFLSDKKKKIKLDLKNEEIKNNHISISPTNKSPETESLQIVTIQTDESICNGNANPENDKIIGNVITESSTPQNQNSTCINDDENEITIIQDNLLPEYREFQNKEWTPENMKLFPFPDIGHIYPTFKENVDYVNEPCFPTLEELTKSFTMFGSHMSPEYLWHLHRLAVIKEMEHKHDILQNSFVNNRSICNKASLTSIIYKHDTPKLEQSSSGNKKTSSASKTNSKMHNMCKKGPSASHQNSSESESSINNSNKTPNTWAHPVLRNTWNPATFSQQNCRMSPLVSTNQSSGPTQQTNIKPESCQISQTSSNAVYPGWFIKSPWTTPHVPYFNPSLQFGLHWHNFWGGLARHPSDHPHFMSSRIFVPDGIVPRHQNKLQLNSEAKPISGDITHTSSKVASMFPMALHPPKLNNPYGLSPSLYNQQKIFSEARSNQQQVKRKSLEEIVDKLKDSEK